MLAKQKKDKERSEKQAQDKKKKDDAAAEKEANKMRMKFKTDPGFVTYLQQRNVDLFQ